jgi:hypothetical protein
LHLEPLTVPDLVYFKNLPAFDFSSGRWRARIPAEAWQRHAAQQESEGHRRDGGKSGAVKKVT